MKTVKEARTKTTKSSKKNDNQPTLFATVSKLNSKSIFETVFPTDDRKNIKFVKPILATDFLSIAFFDATLPTTAIKAIVDDGFNSEELASIKDLQEFGIVCYSKKQDIIELLQLSQKVHELRFWVDSKQLHIYVQIGAKYSYTTWDM